MAIVTLPIPHEVAEVFESVTLDTDGIVRVTYRGRRILRNLGSEELGPTLLAGGIPLGRTMVLWTSAMPEESRRG